MGWFDWLTIAALPVALGLVAVRLLTGWRPKTRRGAMIFVLIGAAALGLLIGRVIGWIADESLAALFAVVGLMVVYDLWRRAKRRA